jgi:formamidopyrimidine-DNA glycosylase
VPELPEVHALVADLGSRLIGHAVKRLDVVSFAALKTFDPPVSALDGRTVSGVSQHGKFLGIRFDITEAGTKQSLAPWLVRNAWEVPVVARLGPDPLGPSFSAHTLGRILATKGRGQIKSVLRDQSTIAGIGDANSDGIVHAAKISSFKPAAMPAHDVARLFDAMQSTLRSAIARTDGLAASELEAEKKANLRVHGRNGLRRPGAVAPAEVASSSRRPRRQRRHRQRQRQRQR